MTTRNFISLVSLCVALFAVFTQKSYATVFLKEGDVFEWHFNVSLGGRGDAWVQFNWQDYIHGADKVKTSFFEDSIYETPLSTGYYVGDPFSYLSGGYYSGFSSKGYFQDGDGVFLLQVIKGSVALDAVAVSANIGGRNFFSEIRPTAIPELANVSGMFGSIVFVFSVICSSNRRRRRNTL